MEVYHYAKFEDFVYTLYTEEKEGYHCAQLEDFTCRHVAVVFSSLARIVGRMFDRSFPECAFLFVCLFVLKWRLARTHEFHSLGQDQSTVAKRAETTVAECSQASCV